MHDSTLASRRRVARLVFPFSCFSFRGDPTDHPRSACAKRKIRAKIFPLIICQRHDDTITSLNARDGDASGPESCVASRRASPLYSQVFVGWKWSISVFTSIRTSIQYFDEARAHFALRGNVEKILQIFFQVRILIPQWRGNNLKISITMQILRYS